MSADLGLSKLAGSLPASFFATVSALNDDGTVSLTWGIGSEADPIIGVAASKSYLNRRATEYDDDGNVSYVGDTVLVQRINGSLLVVGTTNQQDIDFQSLVDDASDDLQDDIDAVSAQANSLDDYASSLDDDITRLENVRIRPTFGTGSAPSGFLQADEVWFKDQGSGRVDVYFRRVTDPGTPSSAPARPTRPPKAKTVTRPKPVTLNPSSRGSWRSNGQKSGSVIQGTWTSRGNWRGGLFYGTAIQSAMSGKTVRSAKLRLTRANGAGGWNRGVSCHVRLITNSSKGDPNFYSGVSMHSVKLSPGQVTTWTLPASWVAALKSGAAKGFGISGSGTGDYLTMGGTSGRLSITFSAS